MIGLINNGLLEGFLYSFLVLGLGTAFRLLKFPDLTVEGSFTLGAVVVSSAMVHSDWYWASALGLGLAACAMAGMFTAAVYTGLRMNKFLSGIVIVTALYSVNLRIMGGGNLNIINKVTIFDEVRNFNNALVGIDWGDIVLLGLTLLLIAVILFLFFKSTTGLRLRAACINPEYASTLGIKKNVGLFIGLAISNALAGLSGGLFAMRAGFADVGLSQGILVTALAALSIGERLLPSKKMSILSYVLLASITGSVIYQIIWVIALHFNLHPTDLKIFSAGILVVVYLINPKKEKTEFEYE